MQLEQYSKILPKLKELAWQTGNLQYKLQRHQVSVYEFLASRQNLTCSLLLSRRFGKTHVCFIQDVETCLKQANSRIAYFYPTLTQGKRILFPISDIVFEDAPPGLAGVWSESDFAYSFANGSKIYVFGCDTMRDIDRHRGPKYTRIRIDEAGVHNYLNYLYKSVLLPTLLTAKEQVLVTFMGTPSPTSEHDFKEIWDSTYVKGDGLMRTIDDNTSIEPAKKALFIQESGGLDSTETQREYYCRWVVDSEFAVIPEWRDEYIQEVERDDLFQFFTCTVGMDIGGRDKTAMVFGYYHFKRAQLIVEYEAILEGQATTVDSIADAWREIAPRYDKIRGWSDTNNVILVQDLLINHGIPFTPVDKSDQKLAMVSELRTMVNAGRVIIHPRCIETIGCLRSAVWDKNRTTYARSLVYGHYDALDALIYLVRHLDTTTNPIPWDYKLDTTQASMVNRLQAPSPYKQLAKAIRGK